MKTTPVLTLTRRVAAHNKTVKASWCRKDFCEMTQTFRKIRAKSKNKMDKCFWCHHAFEDGEMMAVACFEKGGNKTLCPACADTLLASVKNIPGV